MSETANQINLGMLQLQSQLVQGVTDFNLQSSNKNSTQNSLSSIGKNNLTMYAVKGDSKYKKEMDSDEDGIVTFNEYVKYLTEQTFTKHELPNNLAKFTKTTDSATGNEVVKITDIGKSIRTYLNNYLYANLLDAKISTKI